MCPNCCSPCKTWYDLRRIGLTGEGCIRDAAFLSGIASTIPCLQNVIIPNVYIQTPHKTLTALQSMPGATFSRIEIGKRVVPHPVPMNYVFIKSPLIPGKSLLYEACIQQIVKDSLDRGGFIRGAATVHDVFKLHDDSICFSMDIFQHAKPLSVLIQQLPDSELTQFILEILIQLCAMLWHLSTDIGMNHRDLKPSNIMVESHDERELSLRVLERTIKIKSRITLSLIDFGFSCIGSNETQAADLAIGDVYSAADPCPKEGRDLFMFLAFLYMDCKSRIGADLRDLFAKWLQNNVTGILPKIDTYGHEFDQWIYFITGNERIRKFNCCPCNVFNDLTI